MTSVRSPWRFFLVVFILALPFWIIGPSIDPVLRRYIPINLPASALWFVTPILAAAILTYRQEGSAGVKALLKRSVDYRIPRKIWYLPMFLLWPFLLLLEYGVMRLAGMPLPDPQIPILAVPVFFLLFFVGAVCEEAGWTGYALDPLQTRWSALGAALILGVVWGLGHLIPLTQAPHTSSWITFQVLSAIPLRILIVWLYNSTGKSLFSAVVFHDMSNVSQFLYPNYGSHYDPFIAFLFLSLAAVLVTLIWRPAALSRPAPSSETPSPT